MLRNLKPGVSNAWLILIAGMMWSGVGLMLCRSAYSWLALFHWSKEAPLALAGIVLAVLMNRFCFSTIAGKNIARLSLLTGKTCIFAFQRWQSYLLICLMIALGIAVRLSPIPTSYLAVLYTTIGGALLLSSLKYYKCLWQILGARPDTLNPAP